MAVQNLREEKLRVYNQFRERIQRIFPEEVVINNHRFNILDEYKGYIENNDEFDLEEDDVDELISLSEEFIDMARQKIRQEEEKVETTQDNTERRIDRTSSFRKGGLRKKIGI